MLSVLSSEKVRPLTDKVVVKTPEKVEYSIEVNITQNKKAAPSLTAVIYKALNAYTDAQSLGLGLDIIGSKLEALSLVSGVYDADAYITSQTGTVTDHNLTLSDNQYAVCTGISINITGIK